METLRELAARVLGVEKEIIDDDSSPENIGSWDSFNAIMMVSELEKNFNVRFSMEEAMSVKNFKNIKDALKKHGVKEGIND